MCTPINSLQMSTMSSTEYFKETLDENNLSAH